MNVLWGSNDQTSTTSKRNATRGSLPPPPPLFSLFTHDLPSFPNPVVKIYTYTDDKCTASASGRGANSNTKLSLAVGGLVNQLYVSGRFKNLTYSSYPLPRKYRLTPTLILISWSIIVNTDKNVFGFNTDRGETFCQDTQDINDRDKPRLQAMKAKSSQSFGYLKKRVLYGGVRAICSCYSLLGQSCKTPRIFSVSHAGVGENAKLCIAVAICSTRSTPTAHIHAETKVLLWKFT